MIVCDRVFGWIYAVFYFALPSLHVCPSISFLDVLLYYYYYLGDIASKVMGT